MQTTFPSQYVIQVAPSGSGPASLDDADNIQYAIDKLQRDVPEWEVGTVQLSGFYNVNRTLTLGSPGVRSRVRIEGIGHAKLNRWVVGGGAYLIRCYGKSKSVGPVISNLTLNGDYKARGILCSNVFYGGALRDLYIYSTVGSALDLLDHYCTTLTNIHVSKSRGYAVRTRWLNGVHVDGLYLGGNEGAEWMTEDDTACVMDDGRHWITADRGRSLLYCHGYGSTFTNLGIESNRYTDYPLIYLPLKTATEPPSLGNVFDQLYFEGNQARFHKIHADGSNYNEFRSPLIIDGGKSEGNAECFLRCTGNTCGNVVHRLKGWTGFTRGVVLLDGGMHSGTKCTECATTDEKPLIARVNSPVVQAASRTFRSV